jgi:hypothetical protein
MVLGCHLFSKHHARVTHAVHNVLAQAGDAKYCPTLLDGLIPSKCWGTILCLDYAALEAVPELVQITAVASPLAWRQRG